MIEIRVLGDLEIAGADGTCRVVDAGASRALLAHLAAAAPGVAWTDSIITSMWPKGPPASYPSALRNTVTRVRRALRQAGCAEPIEHSANGYRLGTGITTDARHLEQAVTNSRTGTPSDEVVAQLDGALERWRGVPYGNLDGHPFTTERQRLHRLRLEALERHQRHLIELGRHEDGMDRLLEAHHEHPFHEGIVGLMMTTHFLSGDQRAALDLYETTRRKLRDELGLQPSPPLQAAHAAVLQNPPPRAAPRERPSSATAAPARATAPRRTEPAHPMDETEADRSTRIPADPVTPGDAPLSAPSPETFIGHAVAATITHAASGGPHRSDVLRQRADSCAFLGQFADAAAGYLHAAESAREHGDVDHVAALCLRLGTVTWEPVLAARVAEMIDATLPLVHDPVTTASLRICRFGGLFRSGIEAAALGTEPGDDHDHAMAALADDLELIRRRGSADQIGWAITRYRNGLAGMIGPATSLALTDEIITLAPHDPLIVGHTRRAAFVDNLRAGRLARAHRELRAMEANDDDQPLVNRFGTLTARNCWNLAIGRYDAVRRGLGAAMSCRGQFGAHTLDQVILGQSYWLTRETAERSTIEAHLDAASALWESDPSTPLWGAAAALLAVDIDRGERADELITRVTPHLATLPAGSHQLPTLALAAEVVANLDGARHRGLAQHLYHQLAEHPDTTVLVGWPTVLLGSKQRYLGFAALAIGDADTARRHLAAAVHGDRRMPPLRARSERALHDALATHP